MKVSLDVRLARKTAELLEQYALNSNGEPSARAAAHIAKRLQEEVAKVEEAEALRRSAEIGAVLLAIGATLEHVADGRRIGESVADFSRRRERILRQIHALAEMQINALEGKL